MDLFDFPSNLLTLGKTRNIARFQGLRKSVVETSMIALRLESCLVAKLNLELKLPNSKAYVRPAYHKTAFWVFSHHPAQWYHCCYSVLGSSTLEPWGLLSITIPYHSSIHRISAKVLWAPNTVTTSSIHQGFVRCHPMWFAWIHLCIPLHVTA